jgi:hypothetical protein
MSLAPNQAIPTTLWKLPFGQPQIDPMRLANALVTEARRNSELDFRTRLLIRDSLNALEDYWGQSRFDAWYSALDVRDQLQEIRNDSELGEPGFASLRMRLMDETSRETILEFTRQLGLAIRQLQQVFMGGSGALIIQQRIARNTDDIDFVDELPKELREQPQLLDRLVREYGLRASHFASHYLPDGWRRRATSLGRMGNLDVFLLDPLDIFVAKLFSGRAKDQADLRALKPQFERGEIEERVRSSAVKLADEPQIRQHAENNWYVLFGDQLPT